MKLETPSINLPIPKRFALAFLVLSLIGFLDATYLTIKHYLGASITCSIFEGCERVTTSQYATIGNIPVALLGTAYYFMIFILSIAYLDMKRVGIIYFIARFTALGFIASLWFIYLQLFVIGAICLYCVISASTSTLLFMIGLFVIKLKRRGPNFSKIAQI